MAEETNPTQQDTDSNSSAETLSTERKPIPYDRFKQVNDERASFEKQLKDLQEAQRKANESALAERGEYKKLYDQAQEEMKSLRQASEEAKRYRERLEADNLARIERIPEDTRSLIPEYDDPVRMGAWLTANEGLITAPSKPIAPNLGGGAGGASGSNALRLTSEQLEIAKRFGMSPEDYAKVLGILT
jgi:alanyl-tRNA synthetase